MNRIRVRAPTWSVRRSPLLVLVGVLMIAAFLVGIDKITPALLAQGSDSFDPPTPSGVFVRIPSHSSGETVSVPVGGRFAIERESYHGSLYDWEVADVPEFVRFEERLESPAEESSLEVSGRGSSWRVFVFEALRPGRGDLRLEYRLPPEARNAPPERRVASALTVTVVAE